MPQLPVSDQSLLVRTDFSTDRSWKELLRTLARATTDGFRAYVEVVDDPIWHDASVTSVRDAIPESTDASIVFVADHVALADPVYPVLVSEIGGGYRSFRCAATALWIPDNNLNIVNMGFDEFIQAVDSDGIFGRDSTFQDRSA